MDLYYLEQMCGACHNTDDCENCLRQMAERVRMNKKHNPHEDCSDAQRYSEAVQFKEKSLCYVNNPDSFLLSMTITFILIYVINYENKGEQI